VFLGANEDSDPDKEMKVTKTRSGGCITVPVHNYGQAEEVCRKLANENLFAIELCGGFGDLGTARVVRAVEGKVPVGVVQFDLHSLFPEKGVDPVFQ
jgi:hypothetical protein